MRLSAWPLILAVSLASALPLWAVNTTTSSSTVQSPNPLVRQFNTRLKNQLMLIQAGLKSGKLTNNQAAALRASLVSARQQELAFFSQNGTHNLTAAQQSQLNALLNANSATLNEPAPATR